MKRWLTVAALLLAAGVVAWAQAEQETEDAAKMEADLVRMEKEWLDAEARGDLAALDKMFADDFIGTAFGGNVVSKEDVIPREGGGGRFPKSVLKESVVRVYGTTAVVMGRVAVEDPAQPGGFRFTMVWQKRDTGWQVIAAHLSRVPSSE